MKSFAGTVCGLITIVIYGVAVIAGILYHSGYMAWWRSENPNMAVRYNSTYFITWLSFLCAAAVISAIHHALWSIIDNQLEIYGELREQKNKTEEIQQMLKKQMPAQMADGIANANNNRSDLSNWEYDGPKQWICDSCGTVNTGKGRQCKGCGQERD